jgi:hypothetical protein
VHKTLLIAGLIGIPLWFGGLIPTAWADTLTLSDGTTVSGDIVKFDDNSLMLREGDAYTNVQWTLFSQDSLKQLAQDPKKAALVEPFIAPAATARPPKPQLQLQGVERLDVPARTSVIGGLFTSSVGLFLLLMIYVANLYAAYEIALCRSRAVGAAVGSAAVLPLIGPVIFLLLPRPDVGAPAADDETDPEPAPASAPAASPATSTAVPTAAAPAATSPAGPGSPAEEIQVSATSWSPAAESKAAAKPQTIVFPRGKFTFNKRFIETKFPTFIKGTDTGTVMVVTTMKDKFVAQRIGQAGANEMQLVCANGEFMVIYGEIQEIQIKPKDT